MTPDVFLKGGKMFTSVIIPTFNKEKRLGMVLQTLAKQDIGAEKFEVIVVDDGSTDNTRNIVKSIGDNVTINICYIYQTNKGRAAARNTGVKAAKGEIIVFLDDDRLVRGNFIREHVSCFASQSDTNLVVLGKRMCLFFSRFDEIYQDLQRLFEVDPEAVFKRGREEHYYWKKVKSVVDMPAILWMLFTTGNVSMGAGLFEQVGLFNEGFQGWGYEDTELGYRLWLQGIPFLCNETAVNYHLEHLRSRNELALDIRRNQKFLVSIHPKFPLEYFMKFNDGEMSLEEFNRLMTVEMEASH